MTRIWSTNEQNDIFARPGGVLAISTDLQAVLQFCEQAVKTLLGELIYATDRGVNYDQSIFDGSPNLLAFEADARSQITRIPDVISVTEFEASLRSNAIEYTATINTVFGQGVINGGL